MKDRATAWFLGGLVGMILAINAVALLSVPAEAECSTGGPAIIIQSDTEDNVVYVGKLLVGVEIDVLWARYDFKSSKDGKVIKTRLKPVKPKKPNW